MINHPILVTNHMKFLSDTRHTYTMKFELICLLHFASPTKTKKRNLSTFYTSSCRCEATQDVYTQKDSLIKGHMLYQHSSFNLLNPHISLLPESSVLG